jgi:hypothetical protein
MTAAFPFSAELSGKTAFIIWDAHWTRMAAGINCAPRRDWGRCPASDWWRELHSTRRCSKISLTPVAITWASLTTTAPKGRRPFRLWNGRVRCPRRGSAVQGSLAFVFLNSARHDQGLLDFIYKAILAFTRYCQPAIILSNGCRQSRL